MVQSLILDLGVAPQFIHVRKKPSNSTPTQSDTCEWANKATRCDSVLVHRCKVSLPLQVLSQFLRPVLCKHLVHIIFLQPTFVPRPEQRIQPPEGKIIPRVRGKWKQMSKERQRRDRSLWFNLADHQLYMVLEPCKKPCNLLAAMKKTLRWREKCVVNQEFITWWAGGTDGLIDIQAQTNQKKKPSPLNSTYIKARVQNAGLCCLFTSLCVHFIFFVCFVVTFEWISFSLLTPL